MKRGQPKPESSGGAEILQTSFPHICLLPACAGTEPVLYPKPHHTTGTAHSSWPMTQHEENGSRDHSDDLTDVQSGQLIRSEEAPMKLFY